MGTGYVGALYNANGQMSGAGNIAYISKDLRNDHPISIPYGAGGISNSTGLSTTTDPDFVTTNLVRTTTAATAQFYLDFAPLGQRTAADVILYARPKTDFSGLVIAGSVVPSVECGSCHDPHNTVTATFLRMSNSGSALCLACHDK